MDCLKKQTECSVYNPSGRNEKNLLSVRTAPSCAIKWRRLKNVSSNKKKKRGLKFSHVTKRTIFFTVLSTLRYLTTIYISYSSWLSLFSSAIFRVVRRQAEKNDRKTKKTYKTLSSDTPFFDPDAVQVRWDRVILANAEACVWYFSARKKHHADRY